VEDRKVRHRHLVTEGKGAICQPQPANGSAQQ
jgi:hypothetical protein